MICITEGTGWCFFALKAVRYASHRSSLVATVLKDLILTKVVNQSKILSSKIFSVNMSTVKSQHHFDLLQEFEHFGGIRAAITWICRLPSVLTMLMSYRKISLKVTIIFFILSTRPESRTNFFFFNLIGW